MYKAGVLLLVGLLGTVRVQGQHMGFRRLTTDHGLRDNTITCLYEDRAGHLWVGTAAGLHRFDGQRMAAIGGTNYTITAVVEDGAGVIWAATKDQGLLRLAPQRTEAERVHPVADDARSVASDQLSALYDLNDSTLLIGSTEHTLLFLDKRTRTFTYWADSTDLLPAHATATPRMPTGWCHALIPLTDDLLWVGLLNNHLSLLVDRHTLEVVQRPCVMRSGSETQTCAVLVGTDLYTGGWQKGLDLVPLAAGPPAAAPAPVRTVATPDEALHLVRWDADQVLVGTRAHGLLLLDVRGPGGAQAIRSSAEASALPDDHIRSLLVDRAGRLWVGTTNGLALHVPALWRMRAHGPLRTALGDGPAPVFHRLEPEPGGGVRVYSSAGFHVVDAEGNVRHLPVELDGAALQPTVRGRAPDGSPLLGTEYGLLRSTDAGRTYTAPYPLFDESNVAHPTGRMFQVRSIHADVYQGQDVLLIGSLGYGVKLIAAATHRMLGEVGGAAAHGPKSRALVHAVVRDTLGRYWVATGDGVYRWHTGMALGGNEAAGVQKDADQVLAPGYDVRQLVLRADTCWAIAHGGTLLRMVRDRVEPLQPTTAPTKLHGGACDARGVLWMTTDAGLLRYDPRVDTFTSIPVNDGSGTRKLTRAITLLPDGDMAFAADDRVFRFAPEDLDTLPALPPPYLASAASGGKPLVVRNGQVRLHYGASVLDLELSAMAFDHPAPLRFAYRLKGVETDARTCTATDLIRYAGIPEGTHELVVRVQDAYGRVGPEQVLLTVTVVGPFWHQWWFYALAALLVSAGVYAWSRYRLSQALKLQAVRNRIASDLHDEVGSSLSSITIGSQLARQLSSSDNEQVKAILTRIGETSSESLRSISDIVWAIDPKNDQGEALVKRMRRIANELLESKGMDVDFEVSGGVEDLKLPMEVRKELVLIYKEAVHNASKYSMATKVQVALQRRSGHLYLRVADDGRGFDPALHPDGHGLGSMRRRAHALGTTLELESGPGVGTRVAVVVHLARAVAH